MNWGLFALAVAVGLLLGLVVGLLLQGASRTRRDIENEKNARLELLRRVKDMERRMDKIAPEYVHPGGNRGGEP